jgi:hypothetical protein
MTRPPGLPVGVCASACIGGGGSLLPRLAGVIIDRAMRGPGVRLYVLPCRSIVVVWVQSYADKLMLKHCSPYLCGTWAREKQAHGPTLLTVQTVLMELRSAMQELA